MSISDSDSSIDWLASDDDDQDSTVRMNSEHASVPLPTLPVDSQRSQTQARLGDCEATDRDTRPRRHRNCYESAGETPSYLEPWTSESPSLSPLGEHRQFCSSWPSALPIQDRLGRTKPCHAKRALSPCSHGAVERPNQSQSEKDAWFASKCKELQCYILPLSSILSGLQSGRYSERLSRFQESVAMDRIQRIMGVLQNPCMGERYISIIMKVEEMLHNWFPNVGSRVQPIDQDYNDTPTKKQKHHTAPLPGPEQTWHTGLPVCHPPQRGANTTASNSPTTPFRPGRQPRPDRRVTQDSAVSSSTDPEAEGPRRRQPPPGKIRSPCLEKLLKTKESLMGPRTSHGSDESSS